MTPENDRQPVRQKPEEVLSDVLAANPGTRLTQYKAARKAFEIRRGSPAEAVFRRWFDEQWPRLWRKPQALVNVSRILVDGETLKRWYVTYDGAFVADCDTATELWAEFRQHDDRIRASISVPTEQGPVARYHFFEHNKRVDIIHFRAAVRAEAKIKNS